MATDSSSCNLDRSQVVSIPVLEPMLDETIFAERLFPQEESRCHAICTRRLVFRERVRRHSCLKILPMQFFHKNGEP